MRRDEVLGLLSKHQTELKPFKVRSLAVFGSVARDEARSESDIDIVVEFSDPPTFNRHMDLKFYLEELWGCPVDLITRKGLKPRLRTQIERESTHVPGF
jgi:predicted nucleotidyltransferase